MKMVVKTIVVRNLFSYEYDGSNPSLPTKNKLKDLFLNTQQYEQIFYQKGEKMKFKTNKEKGNSSLGIAIAYFSTNGYTVSIPLNDTQDYDLVVEKESKFYSVQVKSTGCKTKYGNYQVALKSCGGTKGKTYKTIIDTNVDLVFIVASDMSMYLIPKSEIKNKSTINLCDNYIKYKIV